jgi:hypothetical protein
VPIASPTERSEDARPAPVPRPRLAGRIWFPAAILFLYLYNFPYFAGINSANELPRIYLSMAIVDRLAFNIDPELVRLGDTPDTSSFKGKRYSNKAPGMSLLTVPVYAVQKWVAGSEPPSLRSMFFWFRLVGATLPSLLFLWLLARFLRDLVPELSLRRMLVAAYALGTMAFTYGTLLIAHQLSSLLCATAFIVGFRYARGGGTWRSPIWAGLAAASGVLVDYQVAFIGPPLFLYLVWAARARARRLGLRRRVPLRSALAFCLGCAPPFAILVFYQWVCFDSPLKTGYHYLTNPVFSQWHAKGFLGLAKFQWGALAARHFSADDGLFYYSPFLLLALPGLVLMFREAELRAEAVLCAALILFFLYFASSLAFVSGWDVGPRYVTCVLPYYLVAVAVLARRIATRWWAQIPLHGLILVGVVLYVTIMAVFPHYPDNFSNPWFDVTLRFGRAGYLSYNLGWLLGLRGLPSALPYLLVAGALLFGLLLSAPAARGWRRPAVGLGAVGLAFLVLLLYHAGLAHRRLPVPVGFLPWMERIWEPRHPGMHLDRLLPTGDPRTGGLETRR